MSIYQKKRKDVNDGKIIDFFNHNGICGLRFLW